MDRNLETLFECCKEKAEGINIEMLELFEKEKVSFPGDHAHPIEIEIWLEGFTKKFRNMKKARLNNSNIFHRPWQGTYSVTSKTEHKIEDVFRKVKTLIKEKRK